MSYKIVKLGEICDFLGGSQPPKSNFIFEPKKDYIRFIQIRDFKSDKNFTYIPISKKNNICKNNDILIGRYGASVGKILTGLSGAYNVALMKTIPNEKIIDKKFLYYYLISDLFQEPLKKISERSAQNGFSKDNIYNFSFALPTLLEQQSIVTKLDVAFAGINKNIVAIEKNINNSKKLFLDILDNLVNETNLGKKILLGEVCTLSQGLAINKATKHLLVTKSNKPLIRIKDLISNTVQKYVDTKYENKKTSVNKEDLIFTRTGSLGLVFRGREGVLHNNSFKVEPKNILSKDYMFWWLQNSTFLKKIHILARKAAQPDISHKLFGSMYIIVPTLQKQKEIFEKVEKCKLDTKTLTELYKNKLKNFIQLKQSILTQELNREFKQAS